MVRETTEIRNLSLDEESPAHVADTASEKYPSVDIHAAVGTSAPPFHDSPRQTDGGGCYPTCPNLPCSSSAFIIPLRNRDIQPRFVDGRQERRDSHAGKKIKKSKRHIGEPLLRPANLQIALRTVLPRVDQPTLIGRDPDIRRIGHEYAAAFANGGGSVIAIAQEGIGVSLLLEVA